MSNGRRWTQTDYFVISIDVVIPLVFAPGWFEEENLLVSELLRQLFL